jgi:putative transposase
VFTGFPSQGTHKYFQEVANEKKWTIKAIEIASDHVHLLVEYDPHHSISQVVKAFKERSSRFI